MFLPHPLSSWAGLLPCGTSPPFRLLSSQVASGPGLEYERQGSGLLGSGARQSGCSRGGGPLSETSLLLTIQEDAPCSR